MLLRNSIVKVVGRGAEIDGRTLARSGIAEITDCLVTVDTDGIHIAPHRQRRKRAMPLMDFAEASDSSISNFEFFGKV